jgi:hypothetical protein
MIELGEDGQCLAQAGPRGVDLTQFGIHVGQVGQGVGFEEAVAEPAVEGQGVAVALHRSSAVTASAMDEAETVPGGCLAGRVAVLGGSGPQAHSAAGVRVTGE